MLCEGRWDNSPGMPFAEKREEERQMTIGMVLALLCGLALFLYGVTLLGDGLNKIAGGKFEAILARLIGSPVKSVLIGAVFSAIVQSSTATSIIAIGFLNSGMMQLSQAAYMILGSILGSSVTGWIVSLTSLGTGGGLTEVLSVANLTALVAIAGIFLRKFRRGARENNIGNLLLGFVILMTGMTAMSAAVEPLEHNKAFLDLMMDFSTSPPLHDRYTGSLEVFLEAGGKESNFFAADCVSTSMTMQGGLDAAGPIVSSHPEIKYWLCNGLFDDLAQAAASIFDQQGLTDTSAVCVFGGSALIQQWE